MFDIQNRRYIGNKFKLMDWISELINENCPNCHSLTEHFKGNNKKNDSNKRDRKKYFSK